MAGGKKAKENWSRLRDTVVETAESLGLEAQMDVQAGTKRISKKRKIHVVATDPRSGKILGIECRTQSTRGTTDEKLLLFIEDIESWPFDGILVFEGSGFGQEIMKYLHSSERAVPLEGLKDHLKWFFELQTTGRAKTLEPRPVG